VTLTRGTIFATHAALAVPIGMLIDTLFLFVFIILVNYGILKSVTISLLTWLALALFVNLIGSTNWIVNILLYAITATLTFFILEYVIKIPSVGKSNKRYTLTQLVIRAIFAGGVVAGAVLLSAFTGPYLVGIFSTFPAVMLSTMLILTINQSPALARATGKVLIVSSSNIVIYGFVVYITYPTLGVVMGTVVSYLLAALWILLLYLALHKYY
jgi:hypothetical protein